MFFQFRFRFWPKVKNILSVIHCRPASTASNRKSCKNSTWYLISLQKKYVFQNIKTNLNLRTWMTLKSSVVIFQALEPLQLQWPLQRQQPPWPQWPLQPHFIKQITAPDDWILPGKQMTNNGPFLWNESSKIQISLSNGGCWGQPILLLQKLLDKT